MVGTRSAQLMTKASVSAFAITRSPITVAEYRDCVSAGACARPAMGKALCAPGPRSAQTYTARAAKAETVPVTCVSVAQAAGYCAWLGARLPKVEEWLLAARGPDVHEFPWGDDEPSCAQHPNAVAALTDPNCCRGQCTAEQLLGVGRHPAGAAPSGMEDVLLTSAELLASDSGAAVRACAGKGGCKVTSLRGASIDALLPAAAAIGGNAQEGAWSFRCARDVQ
ncbi:MAG: SUMF1/EgtB/PvdO family nonheme iron enzyme [Polyangiaceae bacterium]|nr:SUMF1/EgtB/PvdO family nonheme iron enzyme [Polyangiaceae bacterium]